MKTILTLAIASMLLTSCTKEIPGMPNPLKNHKNISDLTLSGYQFGIDNTATLKVDNTTYTGEWYRTDLYFFENKKQTGLITFATLKENEYGDMEFTGTVDFKTQLSGSVLSIDTYTGTGKWMIETSSGVLSHIKQGVGNATYKQVEHAEDTDDPKGVESEYFIEMTGYSKN